MNMIKINIQNHRNNARKIYKNLKKPFILSNAVILSLAAVAIAVWHKIFFNGFKLLGNMLFAASEKYQLYEYDKFEVIDSDSDVVFTLVLLLIVLAAVISLAIYRKNIFVITGIILFFTGAQIYFGVFPQTLLNIFIYAVFAAAIIYCSSASISLHSCVIAIVGSIIIAAVVLVVYSGENIALRAWSEIIRDQFDEKVERYIHTDTESQENNNTPQTPNPFDFLRRKPVNNQKNINNKNVLEYGIEYDYEFSASQAGTTRPRTYWLVLLLLVLWIVGFAAWIIFRLLRESKKRKLFGNPNNRLAIDAMFKYSMDWLRTYKLVPKNDDYLKYITQIEAFSPREYADKYLNAVDVWQRAVYSEHSMTEEQCVFMRSFLTETKKIVNNNVGLVTKIRMYLGYFGGAKQ